VIKTFSIERKCELKEKNKEWNSCNREKQLHWAQWVTQF